MQHGVAAMQHGVPVCGNTCEARSWQLAGELAEPTGNWSPTELGACGGADSQRSCSGAIYCIIQVVQCYK
jgi:hypothetical protein